MTKTVSTVGWREARRQSARVALLDAAWAIVREDGLAGLSLRELARRVGVTTPTVYAYFESKHAIYDAMFGQAASQFAHWLESPTEGGDPRAALVAGVQRFFEFCTADPIRYQLLFQRTLPDFAPSAEAYEPAVRALDLTRERLAESGITEARHVDLFTALTTGLVDQQVSNDPGGVRWTRLAVEAIDMFLAHCEAERASQRPKKSR